MTLILRWLCGLSPREIGQAFLVDTQTIDRRLHRGRGRLRQLGWLPGVEDVPDIGARRDSVLRSLCSWAFPHGQGGRRRRPDRHAHESRDDANRLP